ncbi:hypothetical protein E1176_00870 [Fulvivirga sp. RKSG066]|uniref:hypothetical protein n=1 Tax=Fulvivirga aurantia TaxID=2529383 RepID=UPI0012BBEB03|nr:hypothetical protein [Fulvivirga aurantia]MTI19563.1 hypothetical protein [Fulvivirga aurantia]
MDSIRRFEFNTIYIIESLDSDDKKTGELLYHDLLRWKQLQITYFNSELIQVNSRSEFFHGLEQIKSKSGFENYPYIHFEIHGSKDGFVLNSDEQVTWEEVANRCRELNRICKNNLHVSLATCFGAYILKEIKPFDISPFWGFIGPWEVVKDHDIMVSFQTFFECMFTDDLQNINLFNCIEQLNYSNANLPWRFNFYNAEQVFDKAYENYEETHYQPEALKQRINNLMARGLSDINIRNSTTIPQLRQQIETYIIDNREKIRKAMYKKFMME